MNEEYILYLDMDGVLVDFDGGFIKLSKGIKATDLYKQYGDNAVRQYYLSAGADFWAGLDWIEGGRELWEVSRKLFRRVNILSSAGTSDPEKAKPVIAGKMMWLKKYMPEIPKSNIFIVLGKHHKPAYATKESILVDDVSETIKKWNIKGGYGILHKASNYKNTIETLEDIVRPLNLSEILKCKHP